VAIFDISDHRRINKFRGISDRLGNKSTPSIEPVKACGGPQQFGGTAESGVGRLGSFNQINFAVLHCGHFVARAAINHR